MSLLKKLPNSTLGLKGITPNTFNTNPADKLHETYSLDGTPTVRWNGSNSLPSALPQPTKLSTRTIKNLYDSLRTYLSQKPL